MTTTNFAALAQRLRARAATLAQARLAARRIDPARRWRTPELLWPLFPKG
jgi:hypothetical protein